MADRAPSLLQPVRVHKKDPYRVVILFMGPFYVEWVWLSGVNLLSLKLMVHKKDPYGRVILLWVFLM